MPNRKLPSDCRGATAIEYALLIGLIAVMAIPAFRGVAEQEDQTYQQAAVGLGHYSRHGGQDAGP